MELSELNNPNEIKSVFLLKKEHWVSLGKNQGFQEWPGSVELWEKLEDGRLMCICRWLKKSILYQ